ncbi:MAG: hypothetical protein Q4D33_13895, partial [Prevotellaceae bacterium]|nr:hypothetical protein [Prevotellaceae bacterium]
AQRIFCSKKVHEVRRFGPNGVFFEENIGANLVVSINITTFVPGIYNLSRLERSLLVWCRL